MTQPIICDICGRVHDDWGEIGPAFLSMGILSMKTQNNYIQFDMCVGCWPKDKKAFRQALGEALRAAAAPIQEPPNA